MRELWTARPKKSSLVSGNRMRDNVFINHPPARKTKKTQEDKKHKKLENL